MKSYFLIGMVVFNLCVPHTFFPGRLDWYRLVFGAHEESPIRQVQIVSPEGGTAPTEVSSDGLDGPNKMADRDPRPRPKTGTLSPLFRNQENHCCTRYPYKG